MSRKPKFNPEITRVKLNPEQAVLVCDCYNQDRKAGAGADKPYCVYGPKGTGSGLSDHGTSVS